MIFDTHAHYDDEAFDEDREQLLESLVENGIGAVVDVGASLKSTAQAIALARKYSFVYAAAGVHPTETAELDEDGFRWLSEQADEPKVVAIGEIGLDYHWDTPRDVQQLWFGRQLALAVEKDLPVIIHSREAAADTLDRMKAAWNSARAEGKQLTGVIHCFSYEPEMAREYVKMGFWIGIGGVVTFKNARKTREVVQEIPLEKLVLETDCPYLAPVPHRQERNSSLYLPLVVQEIARLRGITPEEVVRATAQNARELYRLR
ncbi:MAG: TatD family hydrolase [Lachnospiraceae bacterium]|nr:TatD family hydrolase [Lachnospiraceae bacterium]